MKIYLPKKDLRQNITTFLKRKCGYFPLENSYVRRMGTHFYPRFHLYVNENEKNYILNLHLDQKKPSYGNQTAHSGEYGGEVVKEEGERIKNEYSPLERG